MSVLNFWTISDNPPPSRTDCFVVLSYTVKNRLEPTLPTKAVIDLTYKWWKKFPKSKIIMSTGDNQELGISNSHVIVEYAIKLGIPKAQIIEEDKSMTTYENLLYSGKIIKQRHFRKVILVVFDLHARRALAIAKKLGWGNFYWLSAYGKGEPAYGRRHLQTSSRFTIFLYEISAMIYNKIRREL